MADDAEDPRSTGDLGKDIAEAFFSEIRRRLWDPEEVRALKAADFEMIRKVLSDNSITISSVKRGDFGKFAQKVAEEFPFAGDDTEEYTQAVN